MSNNLDISGVLATLLNYDVESSESITSVRNLETTSLEAALNRSRIREQNNRNPQSRNQTRKAIVLQPVAGTPTAASPEEKTTWLNSALAILTGFGATPAQAETMTATYVSNFPEYWVWVLPDSAENVGVIPAFQGTSTVFNVERFTKCVINDAAIEVELLQGACVRIDYENRRLRGGAYVVNIVNNEQDFANAVIIELEGIPSAGGGFSACDERGVSVHHPSGDAISATGNAADLHNAYKAKERSAGSNNISSATIYNKLNTALGNSNLAIGILANAKAESNFNANVVSGVPTESSLGLWQMNVQNSGRVRTPNSNMTSQASSLPSSIRIPSNSSVIRYFAGGLLSASKGVPIISPTDYDSTKDISTIYNTVVNVDNQIDYVIESAQAMLATIPNRVSTITAGEWAQWWQIYFEQPASIHDRASVARRLTTELGAVVI
jgi:hypothetical protein